jgi:hypothetical protein
MMRQIELAEKKEEEEQDYWVSHLRTMIKPKQTWWEKRLAKEEGGSNGDSSGEEANKVAPARWEDNPGSGNCNPESGNCHPESANHNLDSGNSNPGKENERQGEESVPMDVNMVFTIPVEFRPPMEDVTELALGVEHAVFEKPENPDVHMKPLFI